MGVAYSVGFIIYLHQLMRGVMFIDCGCSLSHSILHKLGELEITQATDKRAARATNNIHTPAATSNLDRLDHSTSVWVGAGD